MFPNDDICSPHAAKQAAKRIFQKYTPPTGQATLGDKEVGSIMKAAYEAAGISTIKIQVAYNPDKEDVSEFMKVFNASHNGRIGLEDLQAKALTYLCGDDIIESMQRVSNRVKKQQQIEAVKERTSATMEPQERSFQRKSPEGKEEEENVYLRTSFINSLQEQAAVTSNKKIAGLENCKNQDKMVNPLCQPLSPSTTSKSSASEDFSSHELKKKNSLNQFS